MIGSSNTRAPVAVRALAALLVLTMSVLGCRFPDVSLAPRAGMIEYQRSAQVPFPDDHGLSHVVDQLVGLLVREPPEVDECIDAIRVQGQRPSGQGRGFVRVLCFHRQVCPVLGLMLSAEHGSFPSLSRAMIIALFQLFGMSPVPNDVLIMNSNKSSARGPR